MYTTNSKEPQSFRKVPLSWTFEYEWNHERSEIKFPKAYTTDYHATVYCIENRTLKKKNRFDLYWDNGTNNLCLAAPDHAQREAWKNAFQTFATIDVKNDQTSHPILENSGASSKSSLFSMMSRREKTFEDDNELFLQGQGSWDIRFDASGGQNV